MLELIDISKKYKNSKSNAIDSLNLKVYEGDSLGIIGMNGAGKSTTVSMMATLLTPDSGKILYMGDDIVRDPKVIRRHLGYIPQNIALYESLSGEDNLRFWAKAYHVRKGDFMSRYVKARDMIDIDEEALKKKVKFYSGGMKRRLNIAAAFLHQPKIIILDEPTSGIDIKSRKIILDTIKALNDDGVTIIYVGHYLDEVEYICNRIVVLDNGKCVLDEGLDTVLDRGGSRISLEQFCEKQMSYI